MCHKMLLKRDSPSRNEYCWASLRPYPCNILCYMVILIYIIILSISKIVNSPISSKNLGNRPTLYVYFLANFHALNNKKRTLNYNNHTYDTLVHYHTGQDKRYMSHKVYPSFPSSIRYLVAYYVTR